MRYYQLTALNGVINPEWVNYNEVIPYQAFWENKPEQIKARTVCMIKNQPDFGSVVFCPFPLFNQNMKQAIRLFAGELEKKEFIVLTGDRAKSMVYELLFFPRIMGRVMPDTGNIQVHKQIPEDQPIVYLQTAGEIVVLVRIDLAESMMRKGLCGAELNQVCLNVDKKGEFQ